MVDIAVRESEAPAVVTRRTMSYLGSLYHYAVSVQLADIAAALDFRDWVADTFHLNERFMAEHCDFAPLWAGYLEVIA